MKREVMVTKKGQRIVKEAGEREYKCQCCHKRFLYSYEALIHLCQKGG